jgi:hypothetical protein
MVVLISIFIFLLLIVLEGASSDWGMTRLSHFFGDIFHFSK